MARADHLFDKPSSNQWYARWWRRLRRSKYQPHQGPRERARRVRQRGV